VDAEPEGNWFSRNWKWAAPTGCLLVVLLVGALVATIFFFVFSMMKTNDAYQHAMEAARANPAVVAALGEPMEEGWLVSGSFEESGGSGQAQFAIPLSGPKGSGTLYVEARKSAGEWNYSTMAVEIDTSKERVDLLQAPTKN
jgi:hypothetical protein